ncbi:uncharacterized protein LOC127873084 isoform X2 [Dreissena polymorpha]|nr:uncharacterized protein LOC127873084 isoform X2 [Dreissena polymorpha]XP_052272658.1 uncharacterized protein LOC127873084 isoform X2 [Dreissena polymorpha]XP_052272659.1 uncharacterized protein LOC127873084 isoform X2 [Dreissena polymorpha]XP_052272660.1 uncharacterized protein LOC127873084 isoform X2 [Dreissena polymorpha]
MNEELKEIERSGLSVPADDQCDLKIPDHVLESIDMARFRRGQLVFQKNTFPCIFAMLSSLIVGLSVTNLLQVLVSTGKSSDARSSLRRYLSTLNHLFQWHYGNVFDPTSSASRSVKKVRKMHASVRNIMMNAAISRADETGHVHISQYDMALVQTGFFGLIIMYPREYGVRATQEQLDDYVYFWRWISYCLGIDDRYNLCTDGYERAVSLCAAIETDIVIPALNSPPKDFAAMADAFTDGLNLFALVPLYSKECIMKFGFEASNRMYPHKLSMADKLRTFILKALISACYYVPLFSKFVNHSFEKMFDCKSIT